MAALLKQEVSHLIAIHCVAHRLELGELNAMRENNRLHRLQNLLQFLHKQYHYSPEALRELRMIADALEEKVLKPVNLSSTRWLPYIHMAVKVLLKSYRVIVAHFEDVTSTERRLAPSAEVRDRAKNILKRLLEYKDVLFMTSISSWTV